MKNIIRVEKNKNYFAVSNIPFNDDRLSWEARGVLGYLLSKPDDWVVCNEDLLNSSPAGKHKVNRILAELKENGYMERKRIQGEDGTFTWVTIVYETPISTMTRLSIDGLSVDGKPVDILSTELISTEHIVEPSTENQYMDEWKPTNYSKLSTTFVNLTQIAELTGGARKWNEAIKALDDMQVTPIILKEAVSILADKQYTITGPWSVIATCRNIIIQKNNKRKDISQTVGGQFVEG